MIALPTDGTSSTQLNTLVDACIDCCGKLDILLANAGIGVLSEQHECRDYRDDLFESQLAVNLKNASFCGRAARRRGEARTQSGAGGVIIHRRVTNRLARQSRLRPSDRQRRVISLTRAEAPIL